MSMEQIQGGEEQFKESLVGDLAWALEARRDKIKILGLQAGSVIVTLLLETGIRGEQRPLNVAHDLHEQVADPHSKLKRGKFTARATALSLLPLTSQMQPILLEVSPVMQQFSAQDAAEALPSNNTEAASISLNEHDSGSSGASVIASTPYPGRLRRLLWRWSICVERRKQIHRHATFWLKRSERTSTGNCALIFRTWWQRKREVKAMLAYLDTKRAHMLMRDGLNDWIRFQRLVRLERKADLIYVRRAGKFEASEGMLA